MKKNRKRILMIVLLLTVMTSVGAWWFSGLRRSDNTVPVTARVERRDFSSSVLATGAIKPQVGAEVRVGARISGRVERLRANIGDVVKKGQVIAELEKADLEARVGQRAAELQLAEARLVAVKSLRPIEITKRKAEVDQWQATASLTCKELGRQEKLLKHDATSQQTRDHAKEQSAVAEARLTSAQLALKLAEVGYEEDFKQVAAEVERAKATLAEAKVQLSYATLTAPISGVVAAVTTQEGETVAAGLSAPTFVTIIDLDRLQVDAFVDEVDIGKIQAGQSVVFTVDAFPAQEFEGKITAIYPKAVLQENVVYYDVVVEIASDYDGRLRPEMTASVTVFLEKREGVLAIPTKAVRRERGRNVVYIVLGDGVPQEREIKLGWRDGGWVEVAQGLNEGETVLLESPASPSESEMWR